MTLPTDEQAQQFAIMLKAGLPASQAILYFINSDDPLEINQTLSKWVRSRAVARAQTTLMGKTWQEMTLEEQIDTSLKQHYASLAFLLFSTNYLEANASDKQKLDSARVALEQKQAGTAGKLDPLSQFYADISSGKLALPKPKPFVGMS